MNLRIDTQSVIERSRNLIAAALDIVPYARSAIKKPAAVGYILLTARSAQIALGILLVFLIFLAPIAVDFLTGLVFPPETVKKAFGLIKAHKMSQWKYISYDVIMTFLWLTSVLSALVLVWFHIPRGLARANALAQRLLFAGESHDDAVESRALYKRASALATDPDLVSELNTRLMEGAVSSVSTSQRAGRKIESAKDVTVGGDTKVYVSRSVSRGKTSPSQIGLDRRYILGPELGRGAMGVVLSAHDEVLDRRVAVKQLSLVLSGDDEYATRFRQEARALARLTHPNIVQVYDLIEDGSRLWMVLEYVDGGDLASYLRNKNNLSIGEAASIVIPVAEGLACAHGQGIVHRDLKPANILLTDEQIPKISDFGIAKLSQSGTLTQAGSVLGSPRYMSPEQCSGGAVDARADIYALGITLYELLSGNVPFDGDTSSILARHIVERPRPLSDIVEGIPQELEKLVSRMLAKSPDERISDLADVVDALHLFRERTVFSKQLRSGQTAV